jgi:Domain of unknown function (DUF3885)
MAQIDAYAHTLLGFIDCPSSYDFVCMSDTRRIAVYRIDENAEDYNAKKGDILVGGGKGEAPPLRIAMPEMIHWINDEVEHIESPETILYPMWTPTFSYRIGEGFAKIGWKPEDEELEVWLAEKVMREFVLESNQYSPFETFKEYLFAYFPHSNIVERFTLGGKFELRFELGGDLPNGPKLRIQQATNRACALFDAFFPNKNEEIWLLAYTDLNPYFDETLNQHLPSLLKSSNIETYEEIELACHSGSFDYDENDDSVPIFYDAKLIIAKVKIENLPLENLFSGIASFEMGKTPCFPQEIYFFQNKSANAFRMYDDRGCYLWANEASKIKPFFEKYKNWIPEYHLKEIEAQFST